MHGTSGAGDDVGDAALVDLPLVVGEDGAAVEGGGGAARGHLREGEVGAVGEVEAVGGHSSLGEVILLVLWLLLLLLACLPRKMAVRFLGLTGVWGCCVLGSRSGCVWGLGKWFGKVCRDVDTTLGRNS